MAPHALSVNDFLKEVRTEFEKTKQVDVYHNLIAKQRKLLPPDQHQTFDQDFANALIKTNDSSLTVLLQIIYESSGTDIRGILTDRKNPMSQHVQKPDNRDQRHLVICGLDEIWKPDQHWQIPTNVVAKPRELATHILVHYRTISNLANKNGLKPLLWDDKDALIPRAMRKSKNTFAAASIRNATAELDKEIRSRSEKKRQRSASKPVQSLKRRRVNGYETPREESDDRDTDIERAGSVVSVSESERDLEEEEVVSPQQGRRGRSILPDHPLEELGRLRPRGVSKTSVVWKAIGETEDSELEGEDMDSELQSEATSPEHAGSEHGDTEVETEEEIGADDGSMSVHDDAGPLLEGFDSQVLEPETSSVSEDGLDSLLSNRNAAFEPRNDGRTTLEADTTPSMDSDEITSWKVSGNSRAKIEAELTANQEFLTLVTAAINCKGMTTALSEDFRAHWKQSLAEGEKICGKLEGKLRRMDEEAARLLEECRNRRESLRRQELEDIEVRRKLDERQAERERKRQALDKRNQRLQALRGGSTESS